MAKSDILWTTSEDERLWRAGQWPVIGTDEVGRGPLAGPVVAAAVVLPADDGLVGLRDSKATTARHREALVPLIEGRALAYAVVEASEEEIAERNILGASMWAMAQAVQRVAAQLDGLDAAVVCVDGNRPIPPQLMGTVTLPQVTLVKGDSRCRAIAAAAILAKVHRDRLMVELDARYPVYGFAGHKGYPTAAHLAALEAHGPCPAHRRTFGPVARLLERG